MSGKQSELAITGAQTPERAHTPLDIIQQAITAGASVEALERLVGLQERWQAGEAQAAYNRALVDFQTRCPIVDRGDSANGRAYAKLDRIWRTIRPLMQECGLAVTWHAVEATPDVVTLAGAITHRDGHSVAIAHTIPTQDKLSGQNAAQRAASAETYAKRYAICSALGIQTGDDDDGAAGSPAPSAVTPDTLKRVRELCRVKAVDVAKVEAWAGGKIEAMTEAKAQQALAMLAKK